MMQTFRRFDPFGPVAYFATPPEQDLKYDSYVNLAEVVAVHFYTTRGVKRANVHLAHHQQPTPEVRDSLVLAQFRARLEQYVRDGHWFRSTGVGTEQSTHFINLNQIEAIRFYRLDAFPDETLALVYAGNHEGPYELNRVNSTRDDLARLEALFRGDAAAPIVTEPAAHLAEPPPPAAPLPVAPLEAPAPAEPIRRAGLAGRLPLPAR
jgi:hypothetical protein